MRKGWKTTKLEDVAYLAGRIGWKGLTAKEYTKEGPLFLSVHGLNYGDYVDFRDAFHISQDRYDESPEIMLQPADILLCKDGAGIGKLGIIDALPGPASINSSLLLIRANQGVAPKFLYYGLCSPLFQSLVQERIDGATTPHLYQREIKQLQIPLPPLAEQKQIVAILDEAFEGVDAAIANTEKNLANARELFDSYLNTIFSYPGEGWKVIPLGEVCRLVNGRAYKKPELLDSGKYPVLRVGNFFSNRGWYYSDLELDADKYCDNGDLLYAWSASFGPKIWDGERVIFHYHIWKVEHDVGEVEKRFLFYWFNWDVERIKAEQGVGTAMIHVTKGAMERRAIALPPLAEQERIAACLENLVQQVELLTSAQAAKLEALKSLKQSLLAKAFSGDLTADPDKALQETTA